MRGKERRWKIVALLAVGIAIGVAMTATPAVGHVSGWVHNWNRHIKPRADARYYRKALADARYYNVGETAANAANAANADKLDGLDSNQFQKVPTSAQRHVVAGSAFVDEDGLNRNDAFRSDGTAEQWCTVTGGDRVYASVQLPHGAVITQIISNYGDDAGTTNDNGFMNLVRMPLAGSGATYLDIFATTQTNTPVAGALASASDNTPETAAGAVVDTTKYAYTLIGHTASPNTAFCSVVIEYTVAPGFDVARLVPDPSRHARTTP